MPIQEVLGELENELDRCETLRLHAQENIADEQTRILVYESIIIRAARAHENFVERTFLSYLTGELTTEGNTVSSFASPKDDKHARKLVSSSAGSRFLDWSDVAVVRRRCDVFFEADSPIYNATIVKSSELKWLKTVRNQAAHDSVESRVAFSGVLGTVLLVPPVDPPSVGEFLQMTPRTGPIKLREVLSYFLESLREFAQIASGRSID